MRDPRETPASARLFDALDRRRIGRGHRDAHSNSSPVPRPMSGMRPVAVRAPGGDGGGPGGRRLPRGPVGPVACVRTRGGPQRSRGGRRRCPGSSRPAPRPGRPPGAGAARRRRGGALGVERAA